MARNVSLPTGPARRFCQQCMKPLAEVAFRVDRRTRRRDYSRSDEVKRALAAAADRYAEQREGGVGRNEHDRVDMVFDADALAGLSSEFCWDAGRQEWYRVIMEGGDRDEPTGTYGYRGNGLFCTLRCGFEWAVNHVRQEERGAASGPAAK